MTGLRCGHCGSSRDIQDNFCRQCGHQVTVNLPTVRLPTLPARSVVLPSSLVGSMAVLAMGTGLDWIARRLAANAARAAGRALVSRGETSPAATPKPKPSPPTEVIVDEALYVRKVQLRR